MNIFAIGINFGDNDFYHTFIPLLKAYRHRLEDNDEMPSREKILEDINAMSFIFYKVFQNRGEYEVGDHMEEYLKINMHQLYINEGVDQELKRQEGWCNGEFFYLIETKKNSGVFVAALA